MKSPWITIAKCRLRNAAPSRLPQTARDAARRLTRKLQGFNHRVATLDPGPRGRVLISYILDPFFLSSGVEVPYSHTHFWECFQMARTFAAEGFGVDVIRWTNRRFVPRRPYAVCIDVRLNLERLAPLLNPDCLKIMHVETAHPSYHNQAQLRRREALAARRGVELPAYKLIEANRAIEVADEATVLGNEFTMGTYAFAGKPMHRIPISCPQAYPAPEEKDFARAARHFVWFGSDGFVHKGLDLALEAFAGLPDFHLTVCAPIGRERAFQAAYYRELYRTANIRTAGWVDTGGARFRAICAGAAALIYPTCSEGGGGSVIHCMHAGLIPVVPFEASVDLSPEYGVLLEDVSVEGIRDAVRRLAARPPAELRATALAAHQWANRRHTREAFAAAYRRVVRQWIRRIGQPGTAPAPA